MKLSQKANRIRSRQQGMILIITLMLVALLSSLGLALLGMSGNFLKKAELRAEKGRALALAEGGVALGYTRLNQAQYGVAASDVIQREVEYDDGLRGTVTVRYDMALGTIRSTGRFGDVEEVILVRFGVN